MIALPIDPYVPSILEALKQSPCLVLRASPGSGKTTRVPPALLDALAGEILVLEPRRLAAKFAALRIAEERRERVGGIVGYQFRFESVVSRETRLRFLTEGMLMRKLISDPGLDRASAVILDEFHERHLHGDVALSYLRHLQRTRRPDLKIIVMSATLDTDKISSFLGNCPVITIDAPRFPVTLDYLPSPPARRLEAMVKDAVAGVLKARGGDILVFLPGMGEIRACESALSTLARERGISLHALHGELSKEEQQSAILRGERRKIILSTNVAETSLTIEGVEIVIDSGLHRQASHSWWSGVPALKTRPISRASAEQRAGRAGRTSPGHCVRLYTRHDFDTRPGFEVPEIQRSDLAQTLLELKSLGIGGTGFDWLDNPPPKAVDAAAELLYRLGALVANDVDAAVTSLGRRILEIPAHPRIARLLVEAEARGVLFETVNRVVDLVEGGNPIKTRDQLLSSFPRESRIGRGGNDDAVRFALLTGFPDRVARKRGKELIFSAGGSASVANPDDIAGEETFVVVEVQEIQHAGQARGAWKARMFFPIDEGWLFDLSPSAVREVEIIDWDAERERVVGASRIQYDNLVLAETKGEPKLREEAVRLLLKMGLGLRSEALGQMSVMDWAATLGKVSEAESIAEAMGRLRHLGVAESLLAATMERLLSEKNVFSLAALRETNWTEELLAAFPELSRNLHRLVPTHVTLPSGRKAKIHYPLDKGPWMESRLQDFFGMRTGPAVLDGKLPLTLHLLAPNKRAVQVTSDLAGFWERAYPSIRKELSRKYPRHAWPEDPRVAVAPVRKDR